MDKFTGDIVHGTEEEMRAKYGDQVEVVTLEEAKYLGSLPQEVRPRELATMRFLQSRMELKAPCGSAVQNAFRMGYDKACLDLDEAFQAVMTSPVVPRDAVLPPIQPGAIISDSAGQPIPKLRAVDPLPSSEAQPSV